MSSKEAKAFGPTIATVKDDQCISSTPIYVRVDWFLMTELMDAHDEFKDAPLDTVREKVDRIVRFLPKPVDLSTVAFFILVVQYGFPLPTGFLPTVTVGGQTFSTYGTGVLMKVPDDPHLPIMLTGVWLPEREEIGAMVMTMGESGEPKLYYANTNDRDTMSHAKKVMQRIKNKKKRGNTHKLRMYEATPVQTVNSFVSWVRTYGEIKALHFCKLMLHVPPSLSIRILQDMMDIAMIQAFKAVWDSVMMELDAKCRAETMGYLIMCAESGKIHYGALYNLSSHFPSQFMLCMRMIIAERKASLERRMKEENLKDPEIQKKVKCALHLMKLDDQTYRQTQALVEAGSDFVVRPRVR